jgi:hypothetical protein
MDDTSLEVKVGGSRAAVASWADPQSSTSEYHFSHTTVESCSDFRTDCVSLLGKESSEALMYVIHLVADAT